MEARAMAQHKRGGIYDYNFWVDGTRYHGNSLNENGDKFCVFAPLFVALFKNLSHRRRIAYTRITGRLESGHILTAIVGSFSKRKRPP
jgi:hypothetical protein